MIAGRHVSLMAADSALTSTLTKSRLTARLRTSLSVNEGRADQGARATRMLASAVPNKQSN